MRGNMWEELRRMQRQMDSAFEDFFRNDRRFWPGDGETAKFDTPLTDFWESDKEIKAEIDLPGVDKKDIALNVTKDGIEIKAQKKHEKKEERKGGYSFERSYQGYYRKISLPENADTLNADAKYENGVLTISMPKKELPEYKPKQIDIK